MIRSVTQALCDQKSIPFIRLDPLALLGEHCCRSEYDTFNPGLMELVEAEKYDSPEADALLAELVEKGFELDENGTLRCQLENVEVMGRDVSIVSTNAASMNPVVRSIINADNKVGKIYNLQGQEVAAPAKGIYIMNGKKYLVK